MSRVLTRPDPRAAMAGSKLAICGVIGANVAIAFTKFRSSGRFENASR